MAGDALKSLDKKYADYIYSTLKNPDSIAGHTRGITSAVPLSEIYTKGAVEADDAVSMLLARAQQAGVMGANISSRYALPAGGVALAAKGIVDSMNPQEQTSQAVMP